MTNVDQLTLDFDSKQYPITVGIVSIVISVLLLSFPDSVAAQEVYERIQDPQSDIVKAWEYFRGFVNYVLVAGLMLVAFANVLRISIDTYAVKKILPTLIIAFLLANFSLLISQVLMAIAESLTLSMHQFAISRVGGEDAITALSTGMVKAMFLSGAESIGATVGAVGTGAGLGISVAATLGLGSGVLLPAVIGALVLYILLFLAPTLLSLAILIILNVRFYLLQVLVVLAPVAFMLMAFPFSRNLFQKWFGMLMTWTFMQPVMYAILAIGAIAITF